MGVDNRRIAKNTLMLYFRMFVVMGISLATAGVTLRVLGSVDYGINAVLGGIVAMFSFLNGSLSGAASRFITFELGRGDKDRLNHVFNASLVIHLALGVLIVILSETIGLWFFYNKMIIPAERVSAAFWVLQLSILTVPLSLTQVPYGAVIIAHENMTIFAYVSVADAVVRLLTIYLLLVSPFDKLITLAVLGTSWSVATMIFYRVYCKRKYDETRLRLCVDWKMYGEMFRFAGSDLIGCTSVLLQGQGVNMLLNTFFGPVINAARGIAYAVQGQTTQFSGNFMTAVRPQIIKSYAAGDTEGMWRLVKRSGCYSYYLIWILALPFLLEADYVLKLWLGSYPEHTLSFFRLILVACLIQSLKTPRSAVFHAIGKLFVPNMISGTILCMSFPLAYIALRTGCEPESVFHATNIVMICSEISGLVILKMYYNYSILDYIGTVYLRCIAVTIVSFVVPYFGYSIFSPSFVRVLWTGMLTTLSVGLSALYIGIDKTERIKLFNVARRKISLIVAGA
ncbi:MAG: multidrug transporter [Kiritimatiellae bacterium]|nr:multidrug transporter [Kiritimatiellia bacterium]